MKITLDHRRHAVQIVAQLPENEADALAILEAARHLMTTFLAEPRAERPSPVVAMIGGKGEPA